MSNGLMHREMLIAYLLGTMPEAERRNLAERYFTDEELFDQLLEAENDLLDRYVRGRLDEDEARRFAGYIHRLPDGQLKVAVARALMETGSERSEAVATPAPSSWFRSWFVPQPKPRFALLYALGAMIICLAIGLIWLAIQGQQLRERNEQLRTEIAQLNGDREALPEETQRTLDRIDTLQRELAKARQELESKQLPTGTVQVQQPKQNPPKDSTSPIMVLALAAASRSASNPETLALKPGGKTVSLVAPVEGRDTYTGYQAIVKTTAGESVWQHVDRSASIRKSIDLRIDASRLPPATYKLTLILTTSAGREIPYDYYFRVVKP